MEFDIANLSFFISRGPAPYAGGHWFNDITGAQCNNREAALMSAHDALRGLGLRPADTTLDEAKRLYQASL